MLQFHIKKQALIVCLLLTITYLAPFKIVGQGQQQYIILSGIIIDGDSSYGVPGVHVYIESAKIGTVSSQLGYFSIPCQARDTVIFSAIGYKKHKIIIPDKDESALIVLVNLKSDIALLPIIEIFPYPSIEIFEQAFLSLNLPDPRRQLKENFNKEALYKMSMQLDMGSAANHRYFMEQQINYTSNMYFNPTYSFLNPFAWTKFIQSLKRKKQKKNK